MEPLTDIGLGNLGGVVGTVLLASVVLGGTLLSGAVVDRGACILLNSSLLRVCGWLAPTGLSIGCLELGLGLMPPVSRLCKAGIVHTLVVVGVVIAW